MQFLSFLFLNQPADRYKLPLFETSDHIPKVIHQTYPTKEIPEVIQKNIRHLGKLNPKWEHRLYDDSDIIKFIRHSYGRKILSYYERINPHYGAARADLFR